MEILDQEEEIIDPVGKVLGTIAGIGYIIGGIASIVTAYGSWIAYSSIYTLGAPDATSLSYGIRMMLYAQLFSLPTLLIAIICQRITFHKYSFSPIWLWRVMFGSSLCAILSSIFPLNPIVLIIGIMTLAHLFTKKSFYFFVENDHENS